MGRNQLKIDARCADKEKAEIQKHRFSAYQSTKLLSQSTLKNFCDSTVILGALECRSDGGFHALAGCVAYLSYASSPQVRGNAVSTVL